MLSSELHPRNADQPMLVTEAGIVIDVSELQPENADESMLVTKAGISIVGSKSQS